jgi:hypothetical protein
LPEISRIYEIMSKAILPGYRQSVKSVFFYQTVNLMLKGLLDILYLFWVHGKNRPDAYEVVGKTRKEPSLWGGLINVLARLCSQARVTFITLFLAFYWLFSKGGNDSQFGTDRLKIATDIKYLKIWGWVSLKSGYHNLYFSCIR